LSTDWVAEHWDGAGEFRRAAHVAQLAAGLEALVDGIHDRPAAPPPATGPGATRGGKWSRSGRDALVDRWPR
jgi:hypothetical protein